MLLFIIKSGFPDQYIVIQEDAFEQHPDKNDKMYYTKDEIKKTFKINLSI